MNIWTRIADYLIARAKRTPYFHLGTYMSRWWLVPYVAKDATSRADGVGRVAFWSRPLAWLFQRFDIAVRVHEIHESDPEVMHDHPWSYLTIILKGSYIEQIPVYNSSGIFQYWDYTEYGPGSILWRRCTAQHRLLVTLGTCTTLFITAKYRQKWGFYLNAANKVPYQEYLRRKNLNEDRSERGSC